MGFAGRRASARALKVDMWTDCYIVVQLTEYELSHTALDFITRLAAPWFSYLPSRNPTGSMWLPPALPTLHMRCHPPACT